MKWKCLSRVVAIGIALGCAQLANAAAIVGSMQENFDYPNGTLVPDASTLNGGKGFNATGTNAANAATANWGGSLNAGAAAGTFRTITTPGLTKTGVTGYLNGSGGKLTLDAVTPPNATQNVGRAFGGQTIDAGTTYFSYLTSRNTADTARTFNLAFMNGTTEQMAVGQIGATAGNTNGNIGLLMNNSNPAGLISATTPIAMGTNITHLIVGKIEWSAAGNETVSIWVDPTNVTTEAAAGAVYATTNGFNITGITAMRPFSAATATVATPPLTPPLTGNSVSSNFDEIRLGGTWASVTTQPVPEPAGAALVVIASLALAAFRRAR